MNRLCCHSRRFSCSVEAWGNGKWRGGLPGARHPWGIGPWTSPAASLALRVVIRRLKVTVTARAVVGGANQSEMYHKAKTGGYVRAIPCLALPGRSEIISGSIKMLNPGGHRGTVHSEISLCCLSPWKWSSVASVTWSPLLYVLLLSRTVPSIWRAESRSSDWVPTFLKANRIYSTDSRSPDRLGKTLALLSLSLFSQVFKHSFSFSNATAEIPCAISTSNLANMFVG